MALKRVSDLAAKGYEEIKEYIEKIYDGDNKLPTSKIEVSETQNNDSSLFKSYAYDLNALSGYFTDQLFYRDISVKGVKTFENDVIMKSSLSVVSTTDGSYNDVVIEKNKLDVDIKNDIDIKTENDDIKIDSGDELSMSAYKKINIYSGNDGISTNSTGPINISSNNNISLEGNIINVNGNEEISLTYKDKFTIWFKNSNGEKIEVLTLGHNGDTPTVTFNQSSLSNPVNGYINHALWS